MTRTTPRTGRDRGASVVGFVLVMVPTLILLFVVLQVGVWFYVRSIAASAAAGAARYTALALADPSTGARRAHDQLAGGLDEQTAKEIACTDTFGQDPSGLPIATVRCVGKPKMLLLPLAFPVGIDVHASVLRERAGPATTVATR